MKVSAEEIFTAWKVVTNKDLGSSRFTKKDREEPLDQLCHDFYRYGIDKEEAKSFSRRVQEFMVTRDGQKGQGKYKGWKETVAEEYLGYLVNYYKNDFDQSELKVDSRKIKTYGSMEYMDRQALIVAWSKNRFQENWTEAICLECHKVGSSLNSAFAGEVYSADWAINGNKRPDWARNAY